MAFEPRSRTSLDMGLPSDLDRGSESRAVPSNNAGADALGVPQAEQTGISLMKAPGLTSAPNRRADSSGWTRRRTRKTLGRVHTIFPANTSRPREVPEQPPQSHIFPRTKLRVYFLFRRTRCRSPWRARGAWRSMCQARMPIQPNFISTTLNRATE